MIDTNLTLSLVTTNLKIRSTKLSFTTLQWQFISHIHLLVPSFLSLEDFPMIFRQINIPPYIPCPTAN